MVRPDRASRARRQVRSARRSTSHLGCRGFALLDRHGLPFPTELFTALKNVRLSGLEIAKDPPAFDHIAWPARRDQILRMLPLLRPRMDKIHGILRIVKADLTSKNGAEVAVDIGSREALDCFRKAARAFTTRVTRSRETARQVLISEGIHTKSGKLAKNYR